MRDVSERRGIGFDDVIDGFEIIAEVKGLYDGKNRIPKPREEVTFGVETLR